MKLHPVVSHLNGVVTITLQASYVGDVTDVTDKQRIGAYGDPLVNLGGQFVDPAKPAIGTITLSGIPSGTFVIDGQTFTWVQSGVSTGNTVIGSDGPTSAAEAVISINRDLQSVTAVQSGSTVICTASTPGLAGNLIHFTESSMNMTMNGDGLLGGTQAGTATRSFQIGSELYRGVTTQMGLTPISFMTQIPTGQTGLTPMQAVCADPVWAAGVWSSTMSTRVGEVMRVLRALQPAQLVTLSDSTV